MIAVPIQYSMAAAEKAHLGIAFGVKLDKIKAIAGTIGYKGNIMLFAHRVFYGNKIFVFDFFTADLVLFIRRFSFQRRQINSTAGDHCRTGAVNNIAADRADVEFGF